MTINDLLKNLKNYKEEDIDLIKKAYEYANCLHGTQTRQSGEPYIIHPLNVAYILSELNADRDTICAALLHDTLEDTNTTKEELENLFNEDIANLVDGVTKISGMNFSTKEEKNLANTRKILSSLISDVRIIIIKLADRLHNMRTLEFKSEFKQKENAIETLELFAPLAYYLGAYRIKSELEDLSLKYLKPDVYKSIEEQKLSLQQDSDECLKEMLYKIQSILNNENIPHEIKVRTKNIYGIYKKINKGYKLTDIHDFLALKIMVDEIDDCYKTLGIIHSNYHPINNKFKDYICNPKTNMYQSLHTTVFGPNQKLVQTQIRTFDMDKMASFGLTSYWSKDQEKAKYIMQNSLKKDYQFFISLDRINNMFLDNDDNQKFVNEVKKEILSDNVYIFDPRGKVIELPKGSTIRDYAKRTKRDSWLIPVGALVNNSFEKLNYVLQNKDIVDIVVDDLHYRIEDEELLAQKIAQSQEQIYQEHVELEQKTKRLHT